MNFTRKLCRSSFGADHHLGEIGIDKLIETMRAKVRMN